MGPDRKFIVEKLYKSSLSPRFDYTISCSSPYAIMEQNPMDALRCFLIDTVGTYGLNYEDPWFYSTYTKRLYVRERELIMLAMKFEF